ncbi:uncharacterized protein LOC118435388 [Folsomia candida]|uniref:uncharacterized protein LOC118435388 n=1 Tax=Folsomia candida TaxID=158441 RepID=UPI0016050B73|nr:uncharacterized protein LOC118435388 [Folsomia candida]
MQVRPVGYKQLELSVPLEAVTLEATTQVTEQIMDEEWAMERGVFLSKDDILWPTVAEFELENVARRLYDYIGQCWKLDPKWMFYIHPVQSFTDNLRKRVTFEAKFSVPTQQAPIPQATASVFFIFEMSHYALRDEVVKVHYVVEGTRFRHTPGSIPFQDKWLWSVIMDKVRLQRSLGF